MKQEADKYYFLRASVRIFVGVGQRSAVSSPPSFGVRHGASIHPAAESSFDIRHFVLRISSFSEHPCHP